MPAVIIPAALAAIQLGVGIAKDAKAKKEKKNLMAQIEPFKTPKEILDAAKAAQQNAQSGLPQQTLDYLTNQTDQAFAGSVGVAERLGADPNTLSLIFNNKVNAIKGVSAMDAQARMQNFGVYLNSLNTVGANKAAEQKSQQDILKNSLQQNANERAIASEQISQGINTGVSAYTNYQIGKLYGSKSDNAEDFINAYGSQGSGAADYAKANNLNFKQYSKELNNVLALLGKS